VSGVVLQGAITEDTPSSEYPGSDGVENPGFIGDIWGKDAYKVASRKNSITIWRMTR